MLLKYVDQCLPTNNAMQFRMCKVIISLVMKYKLSIIICSFLSDPDGHPDVWALRPTLDCQSDRSCLDLMFVQRSLEEGYMPIR